MGTRSAPLVFLLLAACISTDGTETAVRDGSGPAPGSAAAARPAPSAGLPAIPRMRPEPPRKTQSTGTAVAQAGGAATGAGSQPGGGAKIPEQSGATTRTGSGSALASDGSADAADASNAVPDPQSGGGQSADADPAAGGAGTVLPPGVDASAASSGGMSEPGSPPADAADGSLSGTDAGAGNAGSAVDPDTDLAIAMPPDIDPGIDVESLFDGDVVRYCAAMWRMGEYIGEARRRGEPLQQAIGNSVRRIAAEKQLPLDNRLAFSGQVYGRLVYRLEDSHAALTLGAYVHFACLTVRGDKKIVPADPNAELLLNSGLVRCESTAFTRDALNDCIFRELTPIVDRRNG